MPQVSRPCRVLLGMLVAVAVAVAVTIAAAVPLPVTGTGPGAGGGPPAAEAAAVSAATTPTAVASASTETPEPGCRERHRDGVGTEPVAPPRGGAAYELLPALFDSGASADSWGADCVTPHFAPGHRPPPLDPPTPMDLSVMRV
ncbi:hypothetical protein [Streptomyces sp. NPDC055287]